MGHMGHARETNLGGEVNLNGFDADVLGTGRHGGVEGLIKMDGKEQFNTTQ